MHLSVHFAPLVSDAGSRTGGRASVPEAVAAGPTAFEMLARPRLLSVVEGRWSRAVTAVVAGAGFGKTTLLDQAMVENRRTRAGRDLPLRIDPGDASAVRLASRILDALGVEGARLAAAPELLDQLVDELWTRAPEQLCLVLDDLHELSPDSDGTRLLRDLTRRLPGNTHLLAGSRDAPGGRHRPIGRQRRGRRAARSGSPVHRAGGTGVRNGPRRGPGAGRGGRRVARARRAAGPVSGRRARPSTSGRRSSAPSRSGTGTASWSWRPSRARTTR